jgi:hypothetical protein
LSTERREIVMVLDRKVMFAREVVVQDEVLAV